MSIIWKYLDKRSAAVDALKDYSSMKFIIEHTDDEIRAAYEKMGGVSSPKSDGMPHTRNPAGAAHCSHYRNCGNYIKTTRLFGRR